MLNESGVTQNVVIAGAPLNQLAPVVIEFQQSATVTGSVNFTTNGATGAGGAGGVTRFLNTSDAGNATFTTNGTAMHGAYGGGTTEFHGSSTAGNGNFTTNGAASGPGGTGARV